MVEILDADYIRTARSKGLRGNRVVLKHAGKNAAVPVITILGVTVGYVIAGSVTVEFVFGIPGVGSLAFSAVSNRDVPMIQAIVLLSAITVLLVNLLVDVAYVYLNPRLRT
jgi:peptide/nickel transport system permease protein